jgi:hypothetical protein
MVGEKMGLFGGASRGGGQRVLPAMEEVAAGRLWRMGGGGGYGGRLEKSKGWRWRKDKQKIRKKVNKK